MSDLQRFGVSIESSLLESFDQLIAERGYATRSEALRDLIRDALVQARISLTDNADVLGSLTLVYDHHARELNDRMADLQHHHHNLVVSVVHVHVGPDDCMEVILLRGRADEVRALADGLLSLKGVKHGKLFVTLPGRQVVRERTGAHRHPHHKSHTH